MSLYLLRLFVVLLFISPAVWAKFSSEQLQDHVKNWVLSEWLQVKDNNTHVVVKRLDHRITLTDCDDMRFEPINKNHQSSKLVVRVSCVAPYPWKVHVPVQIQRFVDVVSVRTPIKRGQEIQEQDVILTRQNVNKLTRGYFKDPAEVLGKVAKRSLGVGMAFSPNTVEEPIVIERGDRVNIIAQIEGLTVKAHGIAQADGRMGETISVKNLTSNRKINAQVVNGHTVKIQL